MDLMQIIRHRRSVRTFDGRALSQEDARQLLEYAAQADNPYGLPVTWKIMSAGKHGLSSPVITGTDAWIAGKMLRAPHAEEAFGYSMEKIVLYAEQMGIGTTIIAGTMNRSAFEEAVELAEGEVMPCVSPLGYPAKKMSLRETMMRKGVKADSRLSFEELFYEGSFGRPLTADAAGDLTDALEMVRWAPSAVNKQPWRIVIDAGKAHFYEKKSKGYVGRDGWDLQKIDIGIAMCHFAAGAEESGKKAELVIEDPGLELSQDTEYIATFIITEG